MSHRIRNRVILQYNATGQRMFFIRKAISAQKLRVSCLDFLFVGILQRERHQRWARNLQILCKNWPRQGRLIYHRKSVVPKVFGSITYRFSKPEIFNYRNIVFCPSPAPHFFDIVEYLCISITKYFSIHNWLVSAHW